MILSGCTRVLVASRVVPPQDEYENDDNRLVVGSIEVGGFAQQRTISPLSDWDWISFEVTAGTAYTIETFARFDEPYWEADTVITLYNSSFSVLDSDDDGGAGVILPTPPPSKRLPSERRRPRPAEACGNSSLGSACNPRHSAPRGAPRFPHPRRQPANPGR
jgi:hypothetical protein